MASLRKAIFSAALVKFHLLTLLTNEVASVIHVNFLEAVCPLLGLNLM